MIARRLFLGGLLASATAPAIVRASSLMPLWVPKPSMDPFGERGFIRNPAFNYSDYDQYAMNRRCRQLFDEAPMAATFRVHRNLPF